MVRSYQEIREYILFLESAVGTMVSSMTVRVFIFEDHWMCREALVAVLGQHPGLEIIDALEDVRSGFAIAVKASPDVVLMDVMFHGEILGIEATARLKKIVPDTKIIVFTEFADEDTLHDAIKAGASGFLLKREVQDPDIVVQAILSVHRGEAYLTPAMTAKIIQVVRRLAHRAPFDLTKRESQVLKLITEGKDNRKIAEKLDINIRTVANHVSNLLFKINAKNRTEAAAIARKERLIN